MKPAGPSEGSSSPASTLAGSLPPDSRPAPLTPARAPAETREGRRPARLEARAADPDADADGIARGQRLARPGHEDLLGAGDADNFGSPPGAGELDLIGILREARVRPGEDPGQTRGGGADPEHGTVGRPV